MPSLAIVIPTCRRSQLLERTLASLAECSFPPNLDRVVIAENGPALGAEAIVDRFSPILPIEYLHYPTPCKSATLNGVLSRLAGRFVIFLDDDVRLHPGCLLAYARTVRGRTGGLFVGGRCAADYEEEPPAWINRYLPLSAKGWSKGEHECPLEAPEALGFNWGAFTDDITAVGGFDVNQGPGHVVPIGEETDLQEKLLRNGVGGRYVPDALVWHYVPVERCSVEWALSRSRLMGVSAGLKLARRPFSSRLRHLAVSEARLIAINAYLKAFSRRLTVQKRFHYLQRVHWRRGLQRGLLGCR